MSKDKKKDKVDKDLKGAVAAAEDAAGTTAKNEIGEAFADIRRIQDNLDNVAKDIDDGVANVDEDVANVDEDVDDDVNDAADEEADADDGADAAEDDGAPIELDDEDVINVLIGLAACAVATVGCVALGTLLVRNRLRRLFL